MHLHAKGFCRADRRERNVIVLPPDEKEPHAALAQHPRGPD
jgi:hypothetical protein